MYFIICIYVYLVYSFYFIENCILYLLLLKVNNKLTIIFN